MLGKSIVVFDMVYYGGLTSNKGPLSEKYKRKTISNSLVIQTLVVLCAA